MFKIITKKMLGPKVFLMEIEAPLVAKKAMPGQFLIVRADKDGERIPLTVCDFDREKGIIRLRRSSSSQEASEQLPYITSSSGSTTTASKSTASRVQGPRSSLFSKTR